MSVDQSKGCNCDQASLYLHLEIENLKQRLLERERHIIKMETNVLKEAEKFPNGEFAAVMDELLTWQEKYSRLYEAHKRVQKVNQGLEDKLLKIVDKCETEKGVLNGELTNLTQKLIQQHAENVRLKDENEMYKNDLNLAIQLLQCKPSNFLPQRFDTLPSELQLRVKSYVASKQRKLSDNGSTVGQKSEGKIIKVPIPTFPPTAMVYSLDPDKDRNAEYCNEKQVPQIDIVSAAILAKVLQEREKERLTTKHCQTCSCAWNHVLEHKSTQTNPEEIVETSETCATCKTQQSLPYEDRHPDLISFSVESDTTSTSEDEKCLKFIKAELENSNSSSSSDSCSKSIKTGLENSTFSSDSNGRSKIDAQYSRPSSEPVRGPRHCSVRVQPGSNNILLDSVAHFSAPVLYKRRYSNDNIDANLPFVPGSILLETSSRTEKSRANTETQI